jgi:hypothetical protein
MRIRWFLVVDRMLLVYNVILILVLNSARLEASFWNRNTNSTTGYKIQDTPQSSLILSSKPFSLFKILVIPATKLIVLTCKTGYDGDVSLEKISNSDDERSNGTHPIR